jgi:hypothetical protein
MQRTQASPSHLWLWTLIMIAGWVSRHRYILPFLHHTYISMCLSVRRIQPTHHSTSSNHLTDSDIRQSTTSSALAIIVAFSPHPQSSRPSTSNTLA